MTIVEILILVVAILIVLFSVGAIVFWIVYRYRKNRAFKLGLACLNNHQFSQALYYLGKAEQDWGINFAHKTPKSIVKDLDRLDEIVAKVAEAALECGHIVDVTDLHSMIRARREIWSSRQYFKFGSHSLKNAIHERDSQVVQSIEEMRVELRKIYRQKPPA